MERNVPAAELLAVAGIRELSGRRHAFSSYRRRHTGRKDSRVVPIWPSRCVPLRVGAAEPQSLPGGTRQDNEPQLCHRQPGDVLR